MESDSSPGSEQRREEKKSKQLSAEALKILWDEFKLVQDKMDRIGDFHFRVRTWAITLVTGAVVAGITNKVAWYIYIATFPLIVSFNVIDKAQTHWQEALASRARQIENIFRRNRQEGPKIAQAIKMKIQEVRETRWGRFVLKNGVFFYGTMYSLSAVACIGSFLSAYGTTIKKWMGL